MKTFLKALLAVGLLTSVPASAVKPITPAFSVTDVTVSEDSGKATFTIKKTSTGNNKYPSTISVTTVDGAAKAGTDYTKLVDVDVEFTALETSKTVTVPLINDSTPEATENFSIKLNPTYNARLSDGTGVATITDSDVVAPPPPPPPPPVVCPDGTTVPAGTTCPVVTPPPPTAQYYFDTITVNEKVGTVTVVPKRTGDLSQKVSYGYNAVDGTAKNASDYQNNSGGLAFYPGMASGQGFTFKILDDLYVEDDEYFTPQISIRDASGATIAVIKGKVIIKSDDTVTQLYKDCPDGSRVLYTQTCPPLPTTMPPIGDIPSPSLEGYAGLQALGGDYMSALTPISNNHVPGEGKPDVVGAYRQLCGPNVLGYHDHIIYPGQPGKSHLHDFNGNKKVNAYSTTQSLLAEGSDSTCNDTGKNYSVQRSSYWIPALLYGDNQVLRVNHVQLYYKRRPLSDPVCQGFDKPKGEGTCIEIPNGLRQVTGSLLIAGKFGPLNYRTDAPPVYWSCHEASGTFKDLVALRNAVGAQCKTLQASISMPSCWDGKYLWKTDRSHLVYASYGSWGYPRCPDSNPYVVTHVSIFYVWNVEGVDLSKLKLASDYMDPTQPAGWSLHSDMHIAWDFRVKKMFHDNCIDKLLNCSGGDLGNGYALIGGGQPIYDVNGVRTPSWTNPNRFEELPPPPATLAMPGMTH